MFGRGIWIAGLAVACVFGAACGSDVTRPSSGAGGSGASGGAGTAGSGAVGGSADGGGGAGGGGGQGTCDVADGDYGDCDLALGWAFDGEDCLAMSGCDCAPDCAAFSSDLASCVAACDGYCDEDAFVGEGIAANGWGEGDFCDEIFLCLKSDTATAVGAYLPGLDCSGGTICGNGQIRCTYAMGVTVSAAQLDQLCAATLIEDVDEIFCGVVGP